MLTRGYRIARRACSRTTPPTMIDTTDQGGTRRSSRDHPPQRLGVRRGSAGGRRALDQVGDEDMPDDIRRIRCYVSMRAKARVGTVCIYEASSPEAIRDHASRADLPVDEIISIADMVVVRPDLSRLRVKSPRPASMTT